MVRTLLMAGVLGVLEPLRLTGGLHVFSANTGMHLRAIRRRAAAVQLSWRRGSTRANVQYRGNVCTRTPVVHTAGERRVLLYRGVEAQTQ